MDSSPSPNDRISASDVVPKRNLLRDLLDSNPTALDGFLSYEYGLCSPHPLRKLSGKFLLWEDWASTLPLLYQTGEYLEYFDRQPILSTEDLSDDDLLRANQILGLSAHAAVHFSSESSTKKNHPVPGATPGAWISERPPPAGTITSNNRDGSSVTKTPSGKCPFKPSSVASSSNAQGSPPPFTASKEGKRIPSAIYIPWREISLRLGRSMPTFTYYDYFTLNVVPVNGNRDAPFHPGRPAKRTYIELTCDVKVFGDRTENIFVLLNHDMEFQSIPLIRLCCDAFDCVLAEDNEKLTMILLEMGEVVKKVKESFLRAVPNCKSPEYFVDPVGWSKSIGMFIPPILDGEFSMSGLQSSFTQLMDVFIGRYCFQGEIGALALSERPWIPSLHQEFLRRLGSISVRDHVRMSSHRALMTSFDRLVRLFASDQGFLGVHRIKTMGFLELGVKTGRTQSSGQTATAEGNTGWQTRTWRKVNEDLLEGINERMHLQTNAKAEGFVEAFVQSIEEQGKGSESYQITFNCAGAGLKYQAGDRLEILPANNPAIINRMLKALRIGKADLANSSLLISVKTDEWKEAAARHYESSKSQESFPLPAILRIMHLRPMTQTIFNAVCEAVGMKGNEKAGIEFRLGRIHDVPELVELLYDIQEQISGPCDALYQLSTRLCEVLPPHKERIYSIANSPCPGSTPSTVSIVVSRLWFEADTITKTKTSLRKSTSNLWTEKSFMDYLAQAADDDSAKDSTGDALVEDFTADEEMPEEAEKVEHLGVCTDFLLKQSLFQYVPIRVIEEESFHLPPVSDKAPLVLVAIGAGAAPIFAFLEELLDRGPEDCPREIYFAWGIRTSKNLINLPLLSRAVEEIGLRLSVSFSGEPKSIRVVGSTIQIVKGRKERITTTMRKGKWPDTLARVASLEGYLYMCGHPMLETSIRSVLESAMSTVGGFSPEQSSGMYERMVVEQRVRSDCFFSGSAYDPSLPDISYSEVAKHTHLNDLWWIYKEHVYDVTEYLNIHPGGTKILFDKGGRDTTVDFEIAHGPGNLRVESAMLPYRIGNLLQPKALRYEDRRAYHFAVSFLHKVVEIRNVFVLDINSFPQSEEAPSIHHSLAMRFKTHEKFITSVIPMLEAATKELSDQLEKSIPRSKLAYLRRDIPYTLNSFQGQLKNLVVGQPGHLIYVATELCRLECDFVSVFLQMVIDFVASMETQFASGVLCERPDASYLPLKSACRKTLDAIKSRLQSLEPLVRSPRHQGDVLALVQSSAAAHGREWKALMPHLEARDLLLLELRKGDFVYRADDIINCVFVVISGLVSEEDDVSQLDLLVRGSFFGARRNAVRVDMANNKMGNERKADVSLRVASDECTVAVLSAVNIERIKRNNNISMLEASSFRSGRWRRCFVRLKVIGALITISKKQAILRSCFASFLRSAKILDVARQCDLVVYSKGQVLCTTGQDATCSWILVHGSVESHFDGAITEASDHPGQMFGESPFLCDERLCHAETRAVEETSCLVIPARVMSECCLELRNQEKELRWLRDQLQAHELFSLVPPHCRIEREFRKVMVRRNENLYEEGESGDSCVVIASGVLELLTSGAGSHNVAELKSGDFAGVQQMFHDSGVRSATCTCREHAICWIIQRSVLESYLGFGCLKSNSRINHRNGRKEPMIKEDSPSSPHTSQTSSCVASDESL